MAEQKVEYIDLANLILWSENPRDSFDENSDNQKITDIALEDVRSKWSLPKLSKSMGDEFDYSELPTVVYHNGKPIVYDGNRRVILGMLKHGLVENNTPKNFKLPEFPEKIPCNVCSHEIGIRNIYRKHAESGSWTPLNRDLFIYKFMEKGKKSTFLLIDDTTHVISNNSILDQRFVKDEIFTDQNLEKLGFKRSGDKLLSKHSDEQTKQLLEDLVDKVTKKEIDTRKKRGDPIAVLDKESKQIIDSNKKKSFTPIDSSSFSNEKPKRTAKTRRTKSKEAPIFGGDLILQAGDVNNLYLDISKVYQHYLKNTSNYSKSFIGLIRMGLRLIVDCAAAENDQKLDEYITQNFSEAKALLSQDHKTYLSENNVEEKTLIQLLHTGAHSYSSSLSNDKAIAISIIVGALLLVTHGKAK